MFVRTKDGIYKVSHYNAYATHKRKGETLLEGYKTSYIKNENIIAQSENLEELCDEFVIEYCDGTMFISIHDNIDDFLIEHKYEIGSGYIKNVYGAIWTDKGLIYVAKMDNEGKLELI